MPMRAGSTPHCLARAGTVRNAALGVLKRHRMPIRRDAILQHEGGDAAFRHPGADVHALVADGEATVTAAGTNDDGRAAGLVRRRWKSCKSRNVGVFSAESAGAALGQSGSAFGAPLAAVSVRLRVSSKKCITD